ncbi:MAG: ISAzo13 family transposase [Phototrophicaceae bacterium]
MPEISELLKQTYIATVKALKGSERCQFMARIAKSLGDGGQSHAAREFHWGRNTIAKGMKELESGIPIADNVSARGRKKAEEKLPNLLTDIRDIVDGASQTDPTFQSTRLYCRLSAAEVRRQLIAQKGYREEVLPSEETIRVKLNALGYKLRAVQKSRPKKVPETDGIFEQLAHVNAEADADERVLRLSLDTKASVWVGPYSCGGQSHVLVKAADHDFHPDAKLTPFGILLPQYGEVFLYFTDSKVTSDFIVDCLVDCWNTLRAHFPQVTRLVLNFDNGPENHSRRTQLMKRITDWVDEVHLTLDLAYYPPYHSKYNPIERVWGVLEKHWNGSLMDSCQTILNFAQTMTFRGLSPQVKLMSTPYATGVKLPQKHMTLLEQRFERLAGLTK